MAKGDTVQLLSCAGHSNSIPVDLPISTQEMSGLANYPQSYPLKMLKSPCFLRGASLCSHGNRNCRLWTPGLVCSSCSGPSWLWLEAAPAQPRPHPRALLGSETQLPLLLLEGNAGTAFQKQSHSARQSCWRSASVKSIINIKINPTGSVLPSYLTFHSSF